MTPEVREKLDAFCGIRHVTGFSLQGVIVLDSVHWRFWSSWRSAQGRYNGFKTLDGLAEMTDDELTMFEDTCVITPIDRVVMFRVIDFKPTQPIENTPENRPLFLSTLALEVHAQLAPRALLYGVDEKSGVVLFEIGEYGTAKYPEYRFANHANAKKPYVPDYVT